jgi:hypothetical protein
MYWNGIAARSIVTVERALFRCRSGKRMAGKKSDDPSPESIARANRQRIAMEEGARAMADVERQAVAVRKNMERLRALREAKEAEALKHAATTGKATANVKRKKRFSK